MKRKIRIALLLMVVFVCGTLSQTFAASTIQQIKATLRTDVKFVVNGQKATLNDSKGKAEYAIVYNGITYIPASEALNALKVPFDYDTKTQTMYLGAKITAPVKLTDLNLIQRSGAFPINKTIDKNILTVEAGDVVKEKTTYKYGLYADNITTYYNIITYNIDKKYKSLKMKAYCVNANNKEVQLIISDKDKGVELYSNKFTTGQMEDVNADVTGVKTLQIQVMIDFFDTTKGQKFLMLEPTLQ